MFHHPGPLRWEVLEKGATERDIDELDASTDAQYGQVLLPGNRKERQLEQVSLAAGGTQDGRRLSAIPGGIYVLASSEDQPVHPSEGTRGH
jgi:hypothetical protein